MNRLNKEAEDILKASDIEWMKSGRYKKYKGSTCGYTSSDEECSMILLQHLWENGLRMDSQNIKIRGKKEAFCMTYIPIINNSLIDTILEYYRIDKSE